MKTMSLIMESWLSTPNLQFNHMSLKRYLTTMIYVLAIMFVAKYLSSGRIGLTKDPLGKTLVHSRSGFLLLFSRTKTLPKGESNVRTTVLLRAQP